MMQRHRGFTLIETMLAVLLLAMLTSAAALTFSKPIAIARAGDAIEQLRSFDSTARRAAVAGGQTVRILFQVSTGNIQRRDGADLSNIRYSSALPAGCRFDQIRIGAELLSSGEIPLDISAQGLSRSYALHVISPQTNQWIVFAGMTGEIKQVPDENAAQHALAPAALP